MKKRIGIAVGLLIILGCTVFVLMTAFHANVETVFDAYENPANKVAEMEFSMAEYPSVVFRCDNDSVTAEKNGEERRLFGGTYVYNIFLSDLNGDNCREICGTVGIGSGIYDIRVYVFDYADSMLYQLQDRMRYHYHLGVDNNRLTAWQSSYSDNEVLMSGTLRLEQRKLSFVSNGVVIAGERASSQINGEILKQMFLQKKEHIARFPSSGQNSSTQITTSDALEYYLSTRKDIFRDALSHAGPGYNVQHLKVKSHLEDFQYMMVLADLAGHYDGYTVYDPNKPEQLFICTEVRDTGYDTIEDYYQALSAGNANAHVDTFVIRLDTYAIYRWGDNQNLYTEFI